LGDSENNSRGTAVQAWHFFLHLRWHYQLFILSGGFLLGGLLSDDLNTTWFILQFLNVHLILFGGATAYNSFWDKDKGPIGGLRNPPKMASWMWLASLLLQMIGLLLTIPMGSLFISIYAVSMLLFWLYSSPWTRWKGHPIKSLFAIGVSTGFCSVLLGYLAAGNVTVNLIVLVAAVGCALILLSLYPVSQIYQREEDTRRGYQTFAIRYGQKVVKRFFEIGFLTGLVLITATILFYHTYLGVLFGIIGLVTGLLVRSNLKSLTAEEDDYYKVMWIKYSTSMAFVCFLLIVLVLKHAAIGGSSSVVQLLLK
jgi:1,4-dihydroxy-2-naphthoate octaprenyltransferase